MHTAFTNYGDFLVLFAQFIGFDEMPGLAEFLLRLLVKGWYTTAKKMTVKLSAKIMFNLCFSTNNY